MKIKVHHQLDCMQCGVACVQMICDWYGRKYSQTFLAKYCQCTSEGVSMLEIREAFSKLGFESLSGYVSLNKISDCPLPCILHWNQNHFVVLFKIKKNRYYIADPSKGLVEYGIDDMTKYWANTDITGDAKGIAMFVEPNSHAQNVPLPDNLSSQNSIRFLYNYICQYRKYFVQIILGLVFGCVLQLSLPFLTQGIVDIGIKNQNINIIWLILLGQFVINVSRISVDYIRRWLLLHISMRINISLISDFFIKLLKLPMSYYDTKLTGDLFQRMNDHSRINGFLTQETLNVAFSAISFVVFGFVLLTYNRLIFFIFVICSIVYGCWMLLFLRQRKVLDYLLFEREANNSNKTFQFITSIQEIKLQNCEKRRRWEWEDVQADLFEVQMKSLKLQQTQEAGCLLINELMNIIIIVLSASAVIKGELTLGMMLAIQYIVGQLDSPIEQLMHFVYSIQDVKISLERINEIHNKCNEENENRILNKFPDKELDIEIKGLEFKYSSHALSKILDNVNVKIPEGKVTAIVGSSGSGKTTLIKLILGYYPIIKGDIYIAGNNINEYNLKWWRQQCGVVMQDGFIFSESIARNIAIDDNDIDFERLEYAIKMSNLEDFINALPLKINTKIGNDGMGLSQGQKQRILIARAVYKNPSYFFLDEATNSLDANNERQIVNNLNSIYCGKTVVVVAHRLSTVRNADQIVVLEKGKVVEIGNHNFLFNKKGYYYNLVKNQLEISE